MMDAKAMGVKGNKTAAKAGTRTSNMRGVGGI